MNLLNKVANSKLSFVFLLCVTVILGTLLFQKSLGAVAPDVPGYSWANHRSVVLMFVSDPGCGCSLAIPSTIQEAAANKREVLLISSKEKVKDFIPKSGHKVDFIKVTDKQILTSISPKNKATILLIENGRVKNEIAGTALSDDFFNTKGFHF